MSDRNPQPGIGVSDYHYAKMTGETKQAGYYDRFKPWLSAVQIQLTDQADNATFDADNGAYTSTPYITNEGHTFTVGGITPEIHVDLMGVTRNDDGTITGGAGIAAPYCAVAWRRLDAKEKSLFVRYRKGTFSFAPIFGAQTKPSTGAPNYQTASVAYKALKPLFGNGATYDYIHEDDAPEGMSLAVLSANWFNSPTWFPKDGNKVIFITAPALSVTVGGTITLTATDPDGKAVEGVTFEVTGGVSADTAIDGDGELTIGEDETAKTLTITATAAGGLSGETEIEVTA